MICRTAVVLGPRSCQTQVRKLAMHVGTGSYRRDMTTETIYRNPVTVEMDRKKAHLEALPGFRLKEDFEALNRCSYTFGRNAQELTEHVGRFLASPTLNAQELTDDYVNELVRLLHNYLTRMWSISRPLPVLFGPGRFGRMRTSPWRRWSSSHPCGRAIRRSGRRGHRAGGRSWY